MYTITYCLWIEDHASARPVKLMPGKISMPGGKASTLLHHQADLAAPGHELAGTIPEPTALDHAALL